VNPHDGTVSLNSFAANVHSQFGEDGILAEIFRRLELSDGYFIEFGGWDGIHLSNAYALVQAGWSGCYIEGNPERYERLCANVPRSGVRKVQRYVAGDGPDSLDNILDEVDAPKRVELLSIDVDGDDLAIWRGLRRHRATCVVIEYNPTIPFDCLFENPHGRNWGNSARSIDDFARASAYALVAATATNLVYVDERGPVKKANLTALSLPDLPVGARYFWGYDGSLLISPVAPVPEADAHAPELFVVPWTGMVAVQPIPKPLRGYHDGPSRITRRRSALAAATAAVSRPVSAARELRRRLSRRLAR
jgi:hypothetical protein